MNTVGHYILASLAPSSRKLYAKSTLRLQEFAVSLAASVIWFPAPVSLICMFIVHLLGAGLSTSTVWSTLSAISFFHKLFRFHDPTADFLVRRIMIGALKSHSSYDTRVPISVPILHKLCDTCERVTNTAYAATLLRAMYLVMFHAFLRIGEVTKSYNNIMWSEVDILPYYATINFHRAKHLTGPPISIAVKASFGGYCPVASLHKYSKVRGQTAGPLFCFTGGQPVLASQFNKWLTGSLSYASLSTLSIKSHSFRIGAATHAATTGYSDAQIQRLGRWNSSAFKKYIRIPSFTTG